LILSRRPAATDDSIQGMLSWLMPAETSTYILSDQAWTLETNQPNTIKWQKRPSLVA
jgi:hypothetical protein